MTREVASISIATAFVLAMPINAHGDDDCSDRSRVLFGPSLAAGAVEEGGKDAGDATPTFGWHAGGAVSIKLHEHSLFKNSFLESSVQLQPELVYVMKGSELPLIRSLDFRFVELGILGQWVFRPCSRIQPYVVLGGEAAYLVSAKNGQTDVESGVKPFDFGAIGGIGVKIVLPRRITLDIAIRHDRGLISMDDSGNSADLKNRAYFLVIDGFWDFAHDPGER